MANKKISDLTANATPATTALVEVEDASASGKTTIAELMTAGGAGDVSEADFGLYRRVRLATSAQYHGNVVIATALANGDTLDGVVLSTNNVVCLGGQTTGSENGAWVIAASGAPSRPTWFPAGGSANASMFVVEEGTSLATRRIVCTNPVASDTVDTDSLVFKVLPRAWAAEASDKPPTTVAQGYDDGFFIGDSYFADNQENRVWIACANDASDLQWTEATGHYTSIDLSVSVPTYTISGDTIGGGSTLGLMHATGVAVTANTGLNGVINLIQGGAGQITVSTGTATRVIAARHRLASTTAKTRAQYSVMTLVFDGTDVYISGDLERAVRAAGTSTFNVDGDDDDVLIQWTGTTTSVNATVDQARPGQVTSITLTGTAGTLEFVAGTGVTLEAEDGKTLTTVAPAASTAVSVSILWLSATHAVVSGNLA